MDLTDPNNLRVAMQLAGIKPKKGLAQHWLMDTSALDQIVASAGLTRSDTVLEIGPGLGVLTSRLTTVAGQVTAVEADTSLAELLNRSAPSNLEVISGDILDFNLSQLPSGYKVVANLPYYLTGKIIRLLLESPNPPDLLVILIQHEVAERIVAQPGQMSVLSLSVQYYSRPEIVGIVERQKFYPPPKVDSAILRIERYQQPAFAADRQQLWRLVRAGFGEKRKQLKNSLAGGLNAEVKIIQELLSKSKLPPTARAQELSLDDWSRLYAVAVKAGLLS